MSEVGYTFTSVFYLELVESCVHMNRVRRVAIYLSHTKTLVLVDDLKERTFLSRIILLEEERLLLGREGGGGEQKERKERRASVY